ncbi:MAG: hypothetical protein GFH24_608298n147 [Chloroflexi bacterium AL-N5]|nr:hypothetical protein [Chloroflexi bacterium AL-N5]
MATLSLQQAFEQARDWIESNDPERAIGLTRHILEYHPNNLDAYCILGEAYLANRQLGEAQEAFERVLSSDPENIPAHVGLGITFERQGMLDRAVSEFEQAWEIKPDLPELRSQLLRLYTDAWGSEQAQLRLSRSGLARLYAKGHMLPQAIEEFRQVITDQPDRLDAKVALVEALWRDGQEDDAIAESEDILNQYPHALKANLILGYLKMSSGEPEGQQFWDTASQLDPHHVVARALFETLPMDDQQEPLVEEWDETAWEAQRALEMQEHAPATRPMAVTAITDILAGASESDTLTTEQENTSSASFAPSDSNNDDFLNELLTLDVLNGAPTENPDMSSPDNKLVMSTFPDSADDTDIDVIPFSLDELGLSQAEIDSLDSLGMDAKADEAPPAAESTISGSEGLSAEDADVDITPFSLEELGLSQAEIDSLDSLGMDAKADEAPPAAESTISGSEGLSAEDADVDITPFSLEELGLSQAEIDSLDSLGMDAKADEAPPAAESTISGSEGLSVDDTDVDITPFSLEELGLNQAEIDSLDDLQDDQRLSDITQSTSAGDSADEPNDLPSELRPFSLDEIDMNSVDSDSASFGDFSSSLQPFSLEDAVASAELENQNARQSDNTEQSEKDSSHQTQGYSWQEPTQRSERNFLSSNEDTDVEEGLSIFAKLKQRKESDPSTSMEEPETNVSEDTNISQGSDDDVSLFSVDNISLRDDSDDTPPSLMDEADTDSAESRQTSPEFESLEAAISSGDVQPFSLSDLGLSDDEIAALGLGEEPQTDNVTSDEQNDVNIPSDQLEEAVLPSITELVASMSDNEIDVTQDNINLSGHEEVDVEVETPNSEAKSTDDDSLMMSDLKPFSLSDLGLSDDEIAALGLGSSEVDDIAETGLGITEDELAGLDIGGQPPDELKSVLPISSIDLSQDNSNFIEEPALDTDPVIDQLVNLGHRQGFIDIADIIAHFEDPEAEADRIEEVGRVLHEANIQIRDGDEIIDMNAEYVDDLEEIRSPQSQYTLPVEGPDMTPFSLSELGLSDDEIASLGIDSSSSDSGTTLGYEQPMPQSLQDIDPLDSVDTPNIEDDVHPFSFTELNLSDNVSDNSNQPDTTGTDTDIGAFATLDEQKDSGSRQSETNLPLQADLTYQQPSSQDVQANSSKTRQDPDHAEASVFPELNMYVDRLEAEPHNHVLRLSLARISGQTGSTEMAVQQYKHLIKNNEFLDDVVDDLQDLIVDTDQTDRRILQRLHRTLGDAYSKQGRFQEAMEEYSWTFSGNAH